MTTDEKNKESDPLRNAPTRKKKRLRTDLHFQADDLLAFKVGEDSYRVVICMRIDRRRQGCNYAFVPTTYKSEHKPVPDDLLKESIIGIKIDSGYDLESMKQMQPGIEEIWNLFPDDDRFFFGLAQLNVAHEDLLQFNDQFEKIGTLTIKSSFKEMVGFAAFYRNFERFKDGFDDPPNFNRPYLFRYIPVTTICETNLPV